MEVGLRRWLNSGERRLSHFFAAAAEAMRRILINRARDKHRLKRGGDRERVQIDLLTDPATAPEECLLELDDALNSLAGTNPPAAAPHLMQERVNALRLGVPVEDVLRRPVFQHPSQWWPGGITLSKAHQAWVTCR